MIRAGQISESKNGRLRVTFCRPEACAKCGACEGNKKQTDIWVNGEGKVGDIAMVDLPDKTVVLASLTAYGLPLVLLLAGLIIGHLISPQSDIASVIGAIIGLCVSLIFLKITEKARSKSEDWNPRIIEITEAEEYGNSTDQSEL